jgi:hypothetical protein
MRSSHAVSIPPSDAFILKKKGKALGSEEGEAMGSEVLSD